MEKSVADIVWTDPAKSDLQDIYDFFLEVSEELADRMVIRIVSHADILFDGFPDRWPLEPLLKDRPEGYHFLVFGNYKIIYRIDGDIAVIDCVFDTRRNPKKLSQKFP